MKDKSKVVILILSLLSGLFLCVAIAVGLVFNNERSMRMDLQNSVQVKEDTLNKAENDLQALRGQLKDLEVNLDDAKSKITLLQDDLNTEKDSNTALQSQINDKLKQIRVLQKQYDDLLMEKEDLQAQIQEQKSAMGSSLSEGTGYEGIAEIPTEEEIAMEEAEPQSATAQKVPVKILEGQVRVVNKEYNFLVINLGSKDGVQVNDTFTIIRGSKIIGKAVVQKVYDMMSSASLTGDAKIADVMEGDKAVRE